MSSNSSFYADGGVYDEAEVVSNDTSSVTADTDAPSGFYPEGTVYDALANSDNVVADMEALAAAAAASAADAAAHDASSATHDTNAAASAAASAASAAAAASSATAAAGSATASAASATTASTQASNAATSATNASNSATAAAGSASTATTQASNASTSATNAASSATAAAGSATAAAGSATAAAGSAASAAASLAAMSPATANPLMDGTVAVGVATKYAREDHVHPTDTSRAPLASPTFTGTPAAPTPTAGDNTTKIATTAFVAASFAPLASPTFTGAITATSKGHKLGSIGGTAYTGALTSSDANIILYDVGSGNWAGVGTDNNGVMWFRTGLSGTASARFWIDNTGIASFALSPTVPTPSANDNSTKVASTAYVDTADALAVKKGTTGTITVGYTVTPNSLGNITSFTVNPALGNYQYGTNHGAATWTAPASDCAVDILVTNDASAGAITFSGFTVSSSTGDALTTTNTSKFIISIRRINSVSTYVIKALQ